MRSLIILVVLIALAAVEAQTGVAEVPIKDITFYLDDFLVGAGPCACEVDPNIVPMCIARMRERCAREVAGDVDWIVANGGFATLPHVGLSRSQVASIFASTTFGPCNVFSQLGYNVTVHTSWNRVYQCRNQTFSGVEAVETVLDPRTQLVTWNWVATEPLDAGLGACIDAILR